MTTASQEATQEFNTPNSPWELLSSMLPTADLTAQAAEGDVTPAVAGPPPHSPPDEPPVGNAQTNDATETPNLYDRIVRILFRKTQRHVLITGLKGVGKTTIIRELARRAAAGEIPFLKDRRFLWIDVSNIGPEDSRACLETITAAAADPPEPPLDFELNDDDNLETAIGRMFESAVERAFQASDDKPEVILCLDGIDALLKRPSGGTNNPLLRAIAARPGVQIIGILDRWAFNDQIAGDAKLMELFTRVDLEEPNDDVALEILKQKAAEFEPQDGVTISDDVLQKTVALASNYVLNECHPAKSIRILRQACDEASFEKTQLGNGHNAIRADDVARVVSEITGIPVATLRGDTGDADFEQLLSEAVMGQDRAVTAAATELRLIKSGLSEPGKPAGVLLFAGMTGVGKTELAKRIAELYSTSKRLLTYSMGNFTEPHSVSGIIGVPPGYVGHEEGGRLINELNADPYSVFLLDEAEKCHPNVWKPFLNLFDEGWIVDQRGVKAHADRAIFILTTNAGDKTIAQMSRQSKPEEEIVDRVKGTLSRVRHERSSQPVFTPQFLARLKRVVVFGPLDETAMIGIAGKIVQEVAELWRQKRDKTLVVTDAVIEAIGKRAFALNEESKGNEGGRIVGKLVSDLIQHRLQVEATRHREAYDGCRTIKVDLEPAGAEDCDPTIAFAA